MRVRYSFSSRRTGRIKNIKKQRTKYPDAMIEVIRISDIILEILDARFIEETRNLEIENKILDSEKILVYVINKSDLISVEEIKSILPVWMKPYVFISAKTGFGQRDLKSRIKMEAKRLLKKRQVETDSLSSKKRIHVGVIGYPNAGKSSVINFITKRGVAKTAKQAGFTKGIQKIKMSEGITVLDTPGVIPEEEYSTESNKSAQDVKVGARTFSDVRNPEDVVAYLMEEYSDRIEDFYKIESNGDTDYLIEKLGKRKKFLGKGGVVDIDRAARLILRDWQEGKIKS